MNNELKVVHCAFKDKALKAHPNKFKEGEACEAVIKSTLTFKS